MAIEKGRSDFDESSLDNNKSNIETGTSIYSLGGGDLQITTNLSDREVKDFSEYVGDFLEPVTLDDIEDINEVVLTVKSDNHPMELNFDKSDLKSYSYFGSLQDRMDYAILNIISKFPASLYVNIVYNYQNLLTYLNRSYDAITNITSFDIPLSSITNNYGLKLMDTDGDTSIKNLAVSFRSYVVWDMEKEYEILEYNTTNNYIKLKVSGNLFSGLNGNNSFHIKPVTKYYNEFLLKLNELEKYLLNTSTTPRYTAIFKDIEYDVDGEPILLDKKYTWSTTDGYNLDFDTSEFESYTGDLRKLSLKYDEYKTNIITRELVSEGVLLYDDDDKRLGKMFNMMGVVFDEIKQFIDSLAYMSRISYDKNGSIPDKVVKNLAKTLGWGVVATYDGKNLINDIVNGKNVPDIKGIESDYTPIETDIELWRRITINTAHLFKSKGTRNAIEFLFALVGAPKSIIDIREYVYIADHPVKEVGNPNNPVDGEGYPKPLNTTDVYFQNKGGWNSKKEVAPSNVNILNSVVGIHRGDYDNGSTYIKSFEQAGFRLTRLENNAKVHVVDGDSSVLDEVLDVNDRRLVINSKEFATYLTPMRYIENEIVKWYKVKYDSTVNNIMDIYVKLIEPSTRKVIEYKGSYPSLYKVIVEFFQENTTIDLKAIYAYVNQLQGFWKDMVEQMIPSTAIWQGGVVYKNNTLNTQKHVYKHGINYGSEFENEILHFKAPKIPVTSYDGEVNLPKEGDIKNILTNANHISTLEFPSIIEENKKVNNVLHIRNKVESHKKTFMDLPMVEVKNVGRMTPSTPLSDYSIIVDNGGGEKIISFIFDTPTPNSYDLFHYNIFKFNHTTQEFEITGKIEGKFTPQQIENASIVNGKRTINVRHFLGDGDYLLKCGYSVNFSFIPVTDDSFAEYYKKITEEGIDSLINFIGTENGVDIFNFDTLIIAETGIYGIYDGNDYYFSIVEKPDIVVVESFATSVTREQAEMVTTRLHIHADGQRNFVLEELPLGDIFLSVNGVTLLKSLYRDLRDGGEYFLYYENDSVQFTLNEEIQISTLDIMTVTYIRDNSNLTINNTGIIDAARLRDVTNDASINYRIGETDIFCYEFDFGYSLNYEISLSSLVVMMNGIKLVRDNNLNLDFDYGISPKDERKLLLFMNKEIFYEVNGDENDVLMVYYPEPLDDGFYIENGRITMTWTAASTTDEGKYVIEISDNINFDGTGRYWKVEVPYKETTDDKVQYSQFVGELDPFLDVNKTFYYRVSNFKKNVDLLGNVQNVTNISFVRTFKTDSKIQL